MIRGAALALLLVIAAGCGGDDSTSAATTTTAAPVAAPASTGAISIKDFAFSPDKQTVAAGTSVTVTNNDTTAHTVTADDGSFDTKEIQPGDTATITVGASTTYHCEIHDYMHGTFTVA
jgi:plastocyanin